MSMLGREVKTITVLKPVNIDLPEIESDEPKAPKPAAPAKIKVNA